LLTFKHASPQVEKYSKIMLSKLEKNIFSGHENAQVSPPVAVGSGSGSVIPICGSGYPKKYFRNRITEVQDIVHFSLPALSALSYSAIDIIMFMTFA
jgi:hypothetical protein